MALDNSRFIILSLFLFPQVRDLVDAGEEIVYIFLSSTGFKSVPHPFVPLCAQVRDLVGADVAPDEPLALQGLDSLASMELRQKLQARLNKAYKFCVCVLTAAACGAHPGL